MNMSDENYTGVSEFGGNKFWRKNGKYHREDDPPL